MDSLVNRISQRADISVDKARKALAATLMDLGTALVAEPAEEDGTRTGEVIVTRPPPPGGAACPPPPIMLTIIVTRPPPEDQLPPPPPPHGKPPTASLHYIAHTAGISEGQARIALDLALDELNQLGRHPPRR
jgi:hypothetical protein